MSSFGVACGHSAPHDFFEVASDQVGYVAKCGERGRIRIPYPKIGVDQVHTQRRLIEQRFVLGGAQRKASSAARRMCRSSSSAPSRASSSRAEKGLMT